jgi:TPR repeat protein
VEKSYQTAYEWFQRAAERGNPEAQYMLGYMLSEGLGCERNQFEAGKWLFLAVKTQGKPHHHEHWLLVRGRLSEKELTEIRLHAAQFKPRKKV